MSQHVPNKNPLQRSYRDQGLEGANFSYMDIRGIDFNNAELKGANFSYAKAGLQRHWEIALVTLSFLFMLFSAFGFAQIGSSLLKLFEVNSSFGYGFAASLSCFTILSLFFIIAIRRGFVLAFGYLVAAGAAIVPLSGDGAAHSATAGIGAALVAFGITFAVAVAAAVSKKAALFVSFSAVILAGATGVIGAIKYGAPSSAAAMVGIIATTMALTCASCGLRALAGDENQAFVRDTAIAIAAWRGTSFFGADLTDANFTGATLKNTDLRETILTRTCWMNAQNINRARKEETYLNNLQRQKLLTQGQGKDNNFSNQNFRFLNLNGANLKNASFIGADFYQASLQQADLSKAILVRTQLEGADLTGACLTGACIEDWVVTRTTELKGAICKYIYVKFLDGEKQERIPREGEFQDGEFIRFVKSILETIELYHERDFKPRAAISVLKSLSKDYNEVLQIVGLKKRGNGIILELKISEWTDKEQLK